MCEDYTRIGDKVQAAKSPPQHHQPSQSRQRFNRSTTPSSNGAQTKAPAQMWPNMLDVVAPNELSPYAACSIIPSSGAS